jgi:DNA mismatch endonuclease (patch repair protein)
MVDVLSKVQRSRNMSAIRSKGNKTTERLMVTLLKKNKITGWRRHYRRLPGNPDFVFMKLRIAIFVDGCFWHGCKKHSKPPTTNSSFWQEKITKTKHRDEKYSKIIQQKGWKVLRFWEHDLKDSPVKVIRRIESKMAKATNA